MCDVVNEVNIPIGRLGCLLAGVLVRKIIYVIAGTWIIYM